jgi:putative ABC transport system permease protein
VSWLPRLRGRDRLRRDIAAELEAHLDEKVEALVAGGMTRPEARLRARRELGNATNIAEAAGDVWRWPIVDDFMLDLRHAARALAHAPLFTLVAVATLALGIGANTAIFSVVNAVLLQPLPFAHPEQLVRIVSTRDGATFGPSPPDLRDMARESRSFTQLVGYDNWDKNLSSDNGDPEQIRVGLVPGEYFTVLGISPLKGRLFAAEENRWGNHHVAIIADSFWRARFAGDPAILGRSVRINEEPFTIVGVVPDVIPPWMDARHKPIRVWTPFAPWPQDPWAEDERDGRGFATVARLKPGVSLDAARADLELVAARLAARHPVDRGVGVKIEPLVASRIGQLRPALLLLMVAVALILLIACFNVANLVLARNSSRAHELSIRAALGASRARLVRQLLTESLLLSCIGGGLGLTLAWYGCDLLAWLHPSAPQIAAAGIDGRVLAFTVVITIVTSLVFGIAPAYSAAMMHPHAALKDGGRSDSGGPARRSLRRLLVAAEVAIALMLSIGAGLLIKSVARLQTQDLGFRTDHLLTERLYLPSTRYPDPGSRTRFCDRFAAEVRNLPGVSAATATDLTPPSYRWQFAFGVVGRPAPEPGTTAIANVGVVDEHYLTTLGIPLKRGRNFLASDTAESPRVVLINETLARRYFANEEPIGKQIDVGQPERLAPAGDGQPMPRLTIIGVIGDTKNRGLLLAADPDLIELYRQSPEQNFGFKRLIVHTTIPPAMLVPRLREVLRAIDPELPFAEVRTMDEIVLEQAADNVFSTWLLTIFALLGLSLAVVGVYGVVSYTVAQRRKEIAIRVALGAQVNDVVRLILREGMVVGGVGIALGIGGALASMQLARSLLFAVSPRDPLTFAGSAIGVAAVILAATLVPCRRALRIEPLEALKAD